MQIQMSLCLCMAPFRPWVNWWGLITNWKHPGFLQIRKFGHLRLFLAWSQACLSISPISSTTSIHFPKWFFLLTICHLPFLKFCAKCSFFLPQQSASSNATCPRSLLWLPQIFTALSLCAQLLSQTGWDYIWKSRCGRCWMIPCCWNGKAYWIYYVYNY